MTTPNPGSVEAHSKGCTCPVVDNCHGEGAFIDPVTNKPQFWIRENCPLHGNLPIKENESCPKK